MQKIVFTIRSNKEIATKTFRLELSCGSKLDIHSGEFVDVALSGRYLRRPFAVVDVLEDGIVIYYKVVGEGTLQLSHITEGQSLELLVGLGNGFNIEACSSDALVVAGGLGAAPLFLLSKELIAVGKRVNVILGFNTASDIVLIDEYRALGIEPLVVTLDGSYGSKGFVTDYISGFKFDYFYTCGPLVMMKNVCSTIPISGECSLEERMGCGVGICYGCTCNTIVGPKRICKDGPVFKKEDILW